MLLFAPHNDDEALFASYVIIRYQPKVIVVTDSFIQFNRGDSITAEQRIKESLAAMAILGADIEFLGIPDNELTVEAFNQKLTEFDPYEPVLVPAIQGGNLQHDLVGEVCSSYFQQVEYYTTYSHEELYTTGEIEIIPTEAEIELKNRALDCYITQLLHPWTRPHFEAVRGKSEWINSKR